MLHNWWRNERSKGMKNWKTTVGGIAGIFTSLAAILGGIVTGHYDAAVGALVALVPSIAHLFAADATKK